MTVPVKRDLIVLVADANMRATMSAVLSRRQALRTRKIDFAVVPHPERDPGCFLRAPDFLRPLRGSYSHAIVMFDREGCGRETLEAVALEKDLCERLERDWGERCAAFVFDPELEIWVWSESPHVDEAIGWKGRDPSLRDWLLESGFVGRRRSKPERPKEAVEKALRMVRKPRSSALYGRLATKVGLQSCRDETFLRFCRIARSWFPQPTE